MSTRPALLVVDVQRDFCPGGALAVKSGDEVIPGLNLVIEAFERRRLPIFFTRDWHPVDHLSFRGRGGIWPPHCVQGTLGAELHPNLRIPATATIISKGTSRDAEVYSGFQGTDLEERLRGLGVDEIFLGGLATDYCVRESTLDALKAGFSVTVIEDCIRPVNAKPGDGDRALADMRRAGARSAKSSEVVKQLAGTRQ
ncbi:MAG TPA: nicotinamidase [Nitrososphaerales archaeon]|nr:nicotinamidase [Nitrososphaerales archaeon]